MFAIGVSEREQVGDRASELRREQSKWWVEVCWRNERNEWVVSGTRERREGVRRG